MALAAGAQPDFSLVLCPSLPRQHWGGFSLAAGVGAARGLAELSLQPRLKWPNDVLLEGEKLAGILLESGNGRLTVGVGVNVNQGRLSSGSPGDSLPSNRLQLEVGPGAGGPGRANLALVPAVAGRRI